MKTEDPNNPPFLRPLEQGDPFFDPPSALAPPITDPQIQILNFRELAWPDYQKLVVSIARDIDGHREAVLWVQDPNPSPDLGLQLAPDPHVLLRRSLASEIASSKELRLDNRVALRLAADERHTVRRAIQRKAR